MSSALACRVWKAFRHALLNFLILAMDDLLQRALQLHSTNIDSDFSVFVVFVFFKGIEHDSSRLYGNCSHPPCIIETVTAINSRSAVLYQFV